jgi:PKD repeat protein
MKKSIYIGVLVLLLISSCQSTQTAEDSIDRPEDVEEEIAVNPPEIEITSDVVEGEAPLDVQFNIQIDGEESGDVAIRWDFWDTYDTDSNGDRMKNDGDTSNDTDSTINNPLVRFNDAGEYLIRVEVSIEDYSMNAEKIIAVNNNNPEIFPFRGMSFGTTWRMGYSETVDDEFFNTLRENNIEWVNPCPLWVMKNDTSNTLAPWIFPIPNDWEYPAAIPDEYIRYIINTAHSHGFKVMLKPMIDLLDRENTSRTRIQPTDWDTWWESYREFLLHYGQIAEETGVDLYVLGTEIPSTLDYVLQWEQTASEVRDIYSGPLTYAALPYIHSHKTPIFWDIFEFIGIDAYYPLTNRNNPTVYEMVASWEKIIERDFLPLVDQYDKKVIFTEIGVCNMDGANRNLEVTCDLMSNPDSIRDDQEQADFYEATMIAFSGREWFEGAFWWDWPLEDPEIWFDEVHSKWRYPIGFDIWDKTAELVLREWYGKQYVDGKFE